MPPHRGGFDPLHGNLKIDGLLNSPKPANSILPSTSSFKLPSGSFFTATFGPYAAIIGTVLIFVVSFAGIYYYFKTYGYTIQMGWDRLKAVFGRKETVDINTTENGETTAAIALIPPPPSPASAMPGGSGSDNGGGGGDPFRSRGPFNPEERPSGMPGAIEGPGFFDRAVQSVEKAFGPGKQIFNINRNIYTYDDAAPLCKAMGAELATFDQVKQAQKHGADWCNYGWVKGQMAVYPTSEETWNKLQTGPHEYRNSCGKPGVNGGRFDNPEIRFGVNCFGTRPQKKDTDELLFDTETGLPPTAEQIEFDKKVQKFRDEMENITVLPWRRGSWSALPI